MYVYMYVRTYMCEMYLGVLEGHANLSGKFPFCVK